MNAPLELSDSVNIKKKRCKCVKREKKSTDVRIISAWGIKKNKWSKKISFDLYSFCTLKFFCTTRKDTHTFSGFPLILVTGLASNKSD